MILTCVHCILPVTVCIALAAADVRFLSRFRIDISSLLVPPPATYFISTVDELVCVARLVRTTKKLFNIFNTKLIFGIPPISVKTHETCTILVQQLHTRRDSNEKIASNHFIWIRSLSPWFLCPLATHVSMIDWHGGLPIWNECLKAVNANNWN